MKVANWSKYLGAAGLFLGGAAMLFFWNDDLEHEIDVAVENAKREQQEDYEPQLIGVDSSTQENHSV